MADPFHNPLPVTIADVHKALTDTGGNREEAGKLLGLTSDQVRDFITNHPEIKVLWVGRGPRGTKDCTQEPPSDAISLDRHPIDAPKLGHGGLKEDTLRAPDVAPDDKALAEAMNAETYRLCLGLEAIGLTEQEVGEAFGLAEFHGMHFKEAIAIIGGGMTRLSVKYQSVVNTLIQNRLVEIAAGLKDAGNDLEKRKHWMQEESLAYASLVAIGAECRKIMDVANRAALTQAVVRSRYSGVHRDNVKRTKPTFNRSEPIEA